MKKSKTIHVEALDSGYLASVDGKKKAIEKKTDVESFIADTLWQLAEKRFFYQTNSFRVTIEFEDNPISMQ